MAIPRTREEFRDYCLRKLGHPVIEINVDLDQVEDRIDEAIKFWNDYHFDGTEKLYFKYQIQQKNYPDSVYQVKIKNSGSGYANGEALIFSDNDANDPAEGSIITDDDGSIVEITMANAGRGFRMPPTVTVDTSGGSGAVLEAELGGFIDVPENIIGAIRIFDLFDSMSTRNMFSIQYQIALNDLYTLTSVSLIPYYTTRMHLELIQQLLVGHQPIRFNRHRNRVYLDMNWYRLHPGDYLIIECYEVIDPDVYTDMWGDRWLQNYATVLIKEQWGSNLIKFVNAGLAGAIQLNGEKIYNDAVEERRKMEEEVISNYSLPVYDMIGVLAAGVISSPIILNTLNSMGLI